ncbi:hypothetical protein Egran_03378 [Elaphomyces granulatus]|uniref:HNH nuclease domain-containing protein n=1 Tax=Elaphomyces granulatus TaxID=519963 RepID=A0A232LXU5_9EURO|nr:hypothetical protein Egran_03378 [Elaphomyces granulatus]
MVQSSSRNEQPMLKRLCLQRDDYRCIVTGTIDPAAERAYPDVVFDENRMGPTNASHIIPFALGRYQNAAQEQNICHIWTTLFALFPALHDVISADTINEPKNVMTLLEVLNTQFGKLNFALEPTDQANTYEIILYRGFTALFYPLQMYTENDR